MRAARPRLQTSDSRRVRPPPKRADRELLTPAWRKLVAEIVAERGARCEDPQHDPARPRVGVRLYGDHVVERRDGGALLDRGNIMLRCASCHSRKTAAARTSRATR